MEWKVEGQTREALVFLPNNPSDIPSPLVFVWHGHGGHAQEMVNAFPLYRNWPEAIVVYPQGLRTPGKLTDFEGHLSGWQFNVGDSNDRDLKFFDSMVESLLKEDETHRRYIFSTGHSNGGRFTQLLWAARGEKLTAIAPSASTMMGLLSDRLKPLPYLHIAGQKDPLVPFSLQQKTIENVLKINNCDEGQIENKFTTSTVTRYNSPIHTPVLTLIHEGEHTVPPESIPLIVKFFKQSIPSE
ncbi:MAG: esterase [Verrucomicrobiota bacterium]